MTIQVEKECGGCEGRGWAMYQSGPDEVSKGECLDCEGIGRITVTEAIDIRVVETVREALPNYTSAWCRCLKDGEPEGDIRFMDDDACTCGIRKHHVHRNACGHVTQIG